MLWQHIRIYLLLIGWISVFQLAVFNSLYSQSLEDIIIEIQEDEEEPLPEEDLFILESIKTSGSGISKKTLQSLTNLSLFSDEEIRWLEDKAQKRIRQNIVDDPHITHSIKTVLKWVDKNNWIPKSNISLKQLVSSKEDVRYRWKGFYSVGFVEAGIIMERDPFESNIADFSAISISKQTNNISWVIGDHRISSGLGLIAGNPFQPVKGFGSSSSLVRFGRGIKMYSSSNEGWKASGMGLSTNTKMGKWSFSINKNKRDGVWDLKLGPKVNLTGDHSSRNPKNRLTETSGLAGWEYSWKEHQIGFTRAIQSWHNENDVSVIYYFTGFHTMIRGNQWKIFGEVGFGRRDGWGVLSGLVYHIKGLRYLLHIRKYKNNYIGYRSSPLAEWGSFGLNESGVFQGLDFSIGPLYTSVFGDVFFHPTVNNGKIGFENGARFRYKKDKIRLTIQYKNSIKSREDGPVYSPEQGISQQKRETLKIVYQGGHHTGIWWKWQVNRVHFNSSNSSATSIGIEGRVGINRKTYRVEVDWVFVKVDNYDSRIYFWDVNLPGEMQNHVYSTPGHSPAVCVRYNPYDTGEFGMRLRGVWDHFSILGPPVLELAIFLNATL